MAALTKAIQKVTETEAVVKISGSDTAASVISLATDLLPYTNILDGVGTVTIGTGATTVVGVGTAFLTASHVNAKIYTSAGVYVGTITSVTDATHATLTANGAAAIAGTTFKISYATQVVVGTPIVNIIGAQWAGEAGAIYKVNRGGTRVVSLLADNGNFMDFVELFPAEPTNNTQDISVTIVNASAAAVQGEVWLRLRKVDGYAGKIETTLYGIYDNVLVTGS
jgi:hypothetical protein